MPKSYFSFIKIINKMEKVLYARTKFYNVRIKNRGSHFQDNHEKIIKVFKEFKIFRYL